MVGVFRRRYFLKAAATFFLLTGNEELTIPDELTVAKNIVREGTTTRGVVLLTPVFVWRVGATPKFVDSIGNTTSVTVVDRIDAPQPMKTSSVLFERCL